MAFPSVKFGRIFASTVYSVGKRAGFQNGADGSIHKRVAVPGIRGHGEHEPRVVLGEGCYNS